MDKAIVLREAGDIINNLIQNEISKQSCPYIPTTPEDVNIDKIVGEIDPVLWRFLESITRTVRNRKNAGIEERNVHVKKLRRLYSLCTPLMYCTNSQKPTILHVFLTDIIEMCGGSRNLKKNFKPIYFYYYNTGGGSKR